MNYKSILVLPILLVLVFCTSVKSITNENQTDYVPNKETAIKIAEAIWYPIYGSKIEKFKPYTAELKEDIWIVQGTLLEGKGGVPYIEINKKDCRILKVMHEK